MKYQDTLTTGQAAEICQVNARTVAKWCDAGILSYYRVPGSLFRRIPKDSLAGFMAEHKFLIPDGLDRRHHVLLVGHDTRLIAALSKALGDDGRFAAESAGSAFDAGVSAARTPPHAAVIDTDLGRIEGGVIAQSLRALPAAPVLIALTRDDGPPPGYADAEFHVTTAPSELAPLVRKLIVSREAERPKVRAAAGAGG